MAGCPLGDWAPEITIRADMAGCPLGDWAPEITIRADMAGCHYVVIGHAIGPNLAYKFT